MKLRSYQQAAVDAVYSHLRNRDDNPVAVLPTGAGKSLVLAKIASAWRLFVMANSWRSICPYPGRGREILWEGLPRGMNPLCYMSILMGMKRVQALNLEIA